MSKIDELKQKFTDSLEDLKKKLPLSGNNSAEDEIDDEEEFEEVDIDDVFDEATSKVNIDPRKLSQDNEGTDKDEDEDEYEYEYEEEDDDVAKKKKQMLIRGLLGVVILYLVYDTFTNTEDTTAVHEAQTRQILKKKPKQNSEPKVAKPAKDQQVVPKVMAKPSAVAKVQAKPEVPVEETTSMPILKEEGIRKTAPVPAPQVKPKLKVELEKNPDTAAEATTQELKTEEEIDLNLNKNIHKLGEDLDKKADSGVDPTVTDVIMSDLEEKNDRYKEKIDQQMNEKKNSTEKARPDMAYVAPPNYKRLGRGLVYNCVDKHWACVDKFAYFQCRENYKYNKIKKNQFECVIKNVYASNKDCNVIQTYYINMGESTKFCNSSSAVQNESVNTTIELNEND